MKAVLDSLDGLADNLKGEYTQGEGGKFFLKVDPVTIGDKMFAMEDIKGLKASVGAARGERDAAQTELRTLKESLEGLDVAAAREAVTKVAEMANWKPEQQVQERINSITNQHNEKINKMKGEYEKKVGTLTSELQRALITEAATRAIATQEGKVKMLLPHIHEMTRLHPMGDKFVVQVLDPQGNPRISPKGASSSPMTVDELVEEMRGTEDFACAFPTKGTTGGGTSGGKPAGGATGAGTSQSKNGKTVNVSSQEDLNANFEAIAAGEAEPA